MAVFNGTSVGIYVQDTLVGASTGCSLDMSMDVIDVTSKDSGGKREILPGTSSWTMSGDFMDSVAGSNYEFADFQGLVDARTLVAVRIDNPSLSGGAGAADYYTGQGYITSVNLTSPMEDVATGSFTIEGTGTLTKASHT